MNAEGAKVSIRLEDVTVPISLCLLVMVAYIFGGALLFSQWEGWGYLDGSYFCFITLSTIGFGDMVPGDAIEDSTGRTKIECFLLKNLSWKDQCTIHYIVQISMFIGRFRILNYFLGNILNLKIWIILIVRDFRTWYKQIKYLKKIMSMETQYEKWNQFFQSNVNQLQNLFHLSF